MNKYLILSLFLIINTYALSQDFIQIGDTKTNYNDFCFSPSGSTVFLTNSNHVTVYDIKTKKNLGQVHDLHRKNITSLQITYDSTILITGGKDSLVIIFDLEKQKEIFRYKHSGYISALEVSLNKKLLISGDSKGNIKIVNLSEKQEIGTINLHKKLISSLSISPDNNYLSSCGFDGKIQLVSLNNDFQVQLLKELKVPVRKTRINRNNDRLYTITDNGKLYSWKLNYPEYSELKSKKYGSSWLTSFDLHKEDKVYVVSNVNGKIIIRTRFGHYNYNAKCTINKVQFIPNKGSIMLLGMTIFNRGFVILPATKMKMNSR